MNAGCVHEGHATEIKYHSVRLAREDGLNGVVRLFSLGEIPLAIERDRGSGTLLADDDRQADEKIFEVRPGIYSQGVHLHVTSDVVERKDCPVRSRLTATSPF